MSPAMRGIPRPPPASADPLAAALALGAGLGDGAVDEDVAGQAGGHGQAGREHGPQLAGPFEPAVVPVELQAQRVLDVGARRARRSRPCPCPPGEGGEPVDVVAGEPGVGHGLQAGLHGQVEVGASEAPADGRLADARDDRLAARGARRRSPCRRAGAGRKRGSQTSSACSKVTSTAMPMRTSSGVAVDDVGGEPDVVLLGDGHEPDDVGVGSRDPLLVVDGEGVHGAVAADRSGPSSAARQ